MSTPALAPRTKSKSKDDLLEIELKFFETHREEYLRSYEGKFVVIKGNQFLGAFPDAATAFRAGTNEHGLQKFLVKQVLKRKHILVSPLLSKNANR